MPKKMVLNFPPRLIDQPITYRLIKDFGLVVNILRARITPREWGRMVVELAEDGGRWQEAMNFLADLRPGALHRVRDLPEGLPLSGHGDLV